MFLKIKINKNNKEKMGIPKKLEHQSKEIQEKYIARQVRRFCISFIGVLAGLTILFLTDNYHKPSLQPLHMQRENMGMVVNSLESRKNYSDNFDEKNLPQRVSQETRAQLKEYFVQEKEAEGSLDKIISSVGEDIKKIEQNPEYNKERNTRGLSGILTGGGVCFLSALYLMGGSWIDESKFS